MTIPTIDGVKIVSGGVVEIPICECGCTPDAWVHDDRNGDAHAFKRIAPAQSNGVYVVTVRGSGMDPWKQAR